MDDRVQLIIDNARNDPDALADANVALRAMYQVRVLSANHNPHHHHHHHTMLPAGHRQTYESEKETLSFHSEGSLDLDTTNWHSSPEKEVMWREVALAIARATAIHLARGIMGNAATVSLPDLCCQPAATFVTN